MDDYLFELHIEKCRYIFEETQYLEIYTYSDSQYDTVVEHPLPLEQFDDFLSQSGAFAKRGLPKGVTKTAGLRVILQQNASNPETFSPSIISLPPDKYSRMMTKFDLPYKGIEGSSTVGPLFWTGYDEPLETFQIIYRKTDDKDNATRGWELLLSYNFTTHITTAFSKGSPESYIVDSVKHMKASSEQIAHPMLFPTIIFSGLFSPDNSARVELYQRAARERLRRIERAFTHHYTAPQSQDNYIDEHGLINFDQINMELTECHSQVLRRSPFAYLHVLDGFDKAMAIFGKKFDEKYNFTCDIDMPKRKPSCQTRSKISSRIDFYRKKLHGQQYYQSITLQRLEVQRSALSMCCSQIDNRVSFQIASAQTKLAHSSKQEAVSQKAIAILGTVFLPGAYLSSLFSTTFFNWQSTPSPSLSLSVSNSPYISPFFWIYWAISIPLTVAVVGSYILWDRKLSKEACKEDKAIELRMLDMKRNSQNRALRVAVGVALGNGVLLGV